MTIRAFRLLTVVSLLLALALPGTGSAARGAMKTDRGVVQAVDATQIVLRALDGSVISFPILPGTKVRLNGAPASLGAIEPGFVATVVQDRKGRAIRIQAAGTPTSTTDRGVVVALTRSAVTVRAPTGDLLTFSIDVGSRFRFLGLPASRSSVRPGALVAVTHATGGRALVVNVLKRAGA